jgi:DeoR family fructose operon transcriptional repressor
MSTEQDDSPALLQHQRQSEILRMALARGSVDVADLAARFGVTTETIRRDLSDMQRRKLLQRIHGGAVPVAQVNHEPMVDARHMRNAAEKLRIAQRAIDYVPEGGSVIIDSGSTGARLAEVFPVDRNVHVVTNSLMTALTLARRGLRDLTVLGGQVSTNTFAMLDSTALDVVRGITVDALFISCDGLSLTRGLTTPFREEEAMKSSMIRQAGTVVAMVDHSKVGLDRMFCFAPFEHLDVLITDSETDEQLLSPVVPEGLDVIYA